MIITAKSSPRPHRRAARNTSVAALEFFIPQEDCGAQSERELLRELLRYGCGRVLTAREQELIRLHVVANSDSERDQALKLRVRDAVLEYLSPRLIGASDSSQAQTILQQELAGIRQAAERAAEGRPVTVALSREHYPTKSYEGFTLPAGKYESLRITLGEGKGHNWWCIVFPPVCLSASQSDTVEQQLGEEDFRLISEGEGYELRFRVLELWGELVG